MIQMSMTRLTVLALLTWLSVSFMYYSKSMKCEEIKNKRCLKWVADSHLSHYLEYGFGFCFPQNTYLQTKNGPTAMGDLQLDDEVLGIDPETGKHAYSKVVAWLHRDAQSMAFFRTIETDKGLNFTASKLHNIAYQTDEGKIDYAFVRELKPGSSLVTSNNKPLRVINSASQEVLSGLFAPMTESGNYFVFSSDFDPSVDVTSASEMILVHSYSQIHHPQANLQAGLNIINAAKWLNYHRQPSNNESFIHPLVGSCRWVFGQDWVQATQKIKVPAEYYTPQAHASLTANHYYGVNKQYGTHYQHFQRLPSSFSSGSRSSFSSYSPRSYSTYNSYNSYSGTGSYNSYNSYGTYGSTYEQEQRRREEEERKQRGLGLNLMFFHDIILY